MKPLVTLISLFSFILATIPSFSQNESAETSSVYEISELHKAPVPYLRIAPTYPATLKENRIRGHVNVVFIVDEKGAVRRPSIEKSTNEEFNDVALSAVKKWKFKPGYYNDQAVKTRVRLPLEFDLEPIEAYDIDDLDVKPEVIEQVTPIYPGAMKRIRKQATVIVEFVVDETGKVVDWEIESSTNQKFNESALTAIKQWTFKPGIKDGESVKARVKIPMKYTLRR